MTESRLAGAISCEKLQDRAVAAMIGIGVGDVMGDLGRDDDVRARLGLVTSLLPDGRSTDDTEFCVLSARAYLDCEGEFTAKAVADVWRKLVMERGGALERGGIPLYGAMWNLEHGVDPPLSGMDNVLNNDDGAAMRAIPFGIVAVGQPEEAARLAGIDASVSHYGDGIAAASAVAASTAVALIGAPIDAVVDAGIRCIPADSWLGRRMRVALDIVASSHDIYDKYAALHTELWTPKHSAAAEAIPQMYALLKLADGDFRKGLIMAANFGRDADTVCALVAALNAARLGTDAFEPAWIEQVRHPSGVCLPFAADEDLVELGKQLAAAAIKRGGGK